MTQAAWFHNAVRARFKTFKQSSPLGNEHLENDDLCNPGDCVECDAARLYLDWIAAQREAGLAPEP